MSRSRTDLGRRPIKSLARAIVLLGGIACAPIGTLFAFPGQVLLEANYPAMAPQGIAFDPTDSTFWVPSLLDGEILHFDADLTFLGSIPSPFLLVNNMTGITYFPPRDSLLVVHPTSFELIEIDKTGAPVPSGLNFFLPIQPVVNPFGPFLRGLAYYGNGNGGLGSFFVVETAGAPIYEIDLQGNFLQLFDHPDDPDGFPGAGAGSGGGGIELILDGTGDLIGFDLIGTEAGAPVIRRLDASGVYTGLSIPLDQLGAGTGSVGGIVRVGFIDDEGNAFDAIYGTLESGPSLFVIDAELPPIAEIIDIQCSSSNDTITVTWTIGQTYDQILVTRNGDPYQVLPGDATQLVDDLLAPSVYRYEVFGVDGTLTTERVSCAGVVGAGQVQDSAIMNNSIAINLAIDLTEDALGTLWITETENFVHAFDKDLAYVTSFQLPFPGTDDVATGIAFRPDTGNLLVCNAFDNSIHEVDFGGIPQAPPFTAQLPVFPNEALGLSAMVYDPTGNGGLGSLFALEASRAEIYELALDGSVLGSFTHPDEVQVPTPIDSFFDTYAFGITGVPETGSGFAELDVSGGNIYERKMSRIVRVDAATGLPTGFQIPTVDIENVNSVRFLAHHNSTYNGDPVAFVISIRGNDNVLLRVDRTPPPLAPVSFLTCRQTGLVDEVTFSFNNHGSYDSIEVDRDGTVVATLPGNATTFLDVNPAPGLRRYRFTAHTAGQSSEPRECTVRVGPGAVLRRTTLWPCVSPYQMARNPIDGSFLVTTNSPQTSDLIYRFDANGQFVDTVIGPVDDPDYQTAAIAVRPTGGTSYEIHTISWALRVPQGMPQVFLYTVQDANGIELLGPTPLAIPGPLPTVALTYPAALTYDAGSDTFWFLERNTDTFWNLNANGFLTQSFYHPDPPAQDFVFNLGLSFDAQRQAFTATTSNFTDLKITKTTAFTRTGLPIGEEIPLDEARINPLFGLARADGRVWVCGSVGELSQWIELKAAGPLTPPTALSCSETSPSSVTLTWTEPAPAAEFVVRRGGVEIASVPGGTGTYLDAGVGDGPRAYTVAARDGALTSSPAACSVIVAGGGVSFIRGDASADLTVDIADAVFVLSYLFNNGVEPSCLDAADLDDNGVVNIGDSVYLLGFLFNNGPQPLQPFPDPGGDPTFDGVQCM